MKHRNTRRPRLLVIDDDPGVCAIIAHILEDEDYDVVTADDGARGLKMFAAEPPDLVITDILMPEKDGIEVIIEMRRARSDALIIALSGGGRVGNTGFLEVAMKLGATASLAKPFGPDELLVMVRSLLDAGRELTAPPSHSRQWPPPTFRSQRPRLAAMCGRLYQTRDLA